MRQKKIKFIDYVDFINDPLNSPLDIVYMMGYWIGSEEYEKLFREAVVNITEETEEEYEHKSRILKFLYRHRKLLK